MTHRRSSANDKFDLMRQAMLYDGMFNLSTIIMATVNELSLGFPTYAQEILLLIRGSATVAHKAHSISRSFFICSLLIINYFHFANFAFITLQT